MSQAGSINVSGGGGGGNITINADSGAPIVGTNFNLLGRQYKTTPIVSTENDSGNTFIENRAWLTPYVVDLSTTPGERGTYSTLQSAVDAAFADGYTVTNQRMGTIYIRGLSGYIIEDVDYPANVCLNIIGLNRAGISLSFLDVVIVGDATVGENVFLLFENIIFSSAVSGYFIEFVNASGVGFINCRLLSPFTYTGEASNLSLFGCDFNSFVCSNPSVNTSPARINNCNMLGASTLFSGDFKTRFNNCSVTQVLINDTSSVDLYNCIADQINNSPVIAGGSTDECIVSNLHINVISDDPGVFFNYNGTLKLGDISLNYNIPNTNVTDIALGLNVIPLVKSKGNITTSITITDDYICSETDEFIWVDHEDIVTIVLSEFMATEQEIKIKDKSLNASTFNISIFPNVGLIEGQSSLVISTDGQCVTIKYDGTNYFVI